MRRHAALLLLLAGCGDAPPDVDAPGPLDAITSTECTIVRYGLEPSDCLAQWDCGVEGVVALVCATAVDGGAACACVHPNVDPVVIDDLPPSCSDDQVLTEFTRDRCAWSFL